MIEPIAGSDAPLTILDGHPKGLSQSQLLADPAVVGRLIVVEFDLGDDAEAR